jgi:hypothetical protein
MEVTYDHAARIVRTWQLTTKRECIAQLIAQELHNIDSETSLLLHPSAPGATSANTQRLFRVDNGWINGRTDAQRRKFVELIPAIERALLVDKKPRLLAQMRSYSSSSWRELVDRAARIDSEVDALFGVMLSMSERHYGSGPAGNNLFH